MDFAVAVMEPDGGEALAEGTPQREEIVEIAVSGYAPRDRIGLEQRHADKQEALAALPPGAPLPL